MSFIQDSLNIPHVLCVFSFMYACSIIPKSGLLANISVHSCMRSRIFAFTC